MNQRAGVQQLQAGRCGDEPAVVVGLLAHGAPAPVRERGAQSLAARQHEIAGGGDQWHQVRAGRGERTRPGVDERGELCVDAPDHRIAHAGHPPDITLHR